MNINGTCCTPMVELVGVAEGVHDGLENRFQNFQVVIYTKSSHKKIQKLAQKLLPIAAPRASKTKTKFI